MKALIDTDVILDVALARKHFVKDSADVLRWAERSGNAYIAWHSLSNCAYLLKSNGRTFLSGLLKIVDVAVSNKSDAIAALRYPMNDLEDALQVAAAVKAGCDTVITRNTVDYRNAPIPVCTPSEFIHNL